MFSIVSRFLKSPFQTIREEQTLVKFVIVGASGTGVNLFVSYILFHLFVQAVTAQAIGIELSVINNFIWNDSFTFKNSTKNLKGKNHNKLRRLLKYNGLSLGTSILNLSVFSILAYPLGLNHGLWYVLSSLTAIFVAFVFNYIGSSRWAWKSNKENNFLNIEKRAPMVND